MALISEPHRFGPKNHHCVVLHQRSKSLVGSVSNESRTTVRPLTAVSLCGQPPARHDHGSFQNAGLSGRDGLAIDNVKIEWAQKSESG